MKKICLIAQFPPPIHGLSKAVDTLYNSDLAEEFALEKVDIKDNKRILQTLSAIRRSDADLFYFTISQRRGGNLRDLLILRAVGERPCLIHLHGGYFRELLDQLPQWQKKANYKALGKLRGAIVLSPRLRAIFRGLLPEEKIVVIPNCVDDVYLMSDEEWEEKLAGLPNRAVKHVLYLSHFIRTKGYPEVLEMARLEKERVEAGGERRFHFDFAGAFFEKREERFFWRYIAENGLEEYVTYHGVVDGDRKRALLKGCDVFALLTRYPKEGQPISLLEAMGNGMVVVTTDHAGIGDLVADGVDGILISSRENPAKEAYEKIQEVCFEEFQRRGRAKVMRDYRQRNYVESMKQIFRAIWLKQREAEHTDAY